MSPQYGEQTYWQSRFMKDESAFDWLIPADDLHQAIAKAIERCRHTNPTILHIGCGTSSLSFHLPKYVQSAAQIHNIDFSLAAIRIGQKRERKRLDGETEDQDLTASERTSMRWSALDLLSIDQVALIRTNPYHLVLDKSTSDSISCAEDVPIHLPYPLLSDSTSGMQTSPPHLNDDSVGNRIHPLYLLAIHLAFLVPVGAQWLVWSYSNDRFPFLAPTTQTAEDAYWERALEQAGLVHPRRLWIPKEKRAIETCENTTDEAGSHQVHRPAVNHYMYLLIRTDLTLEYVETAG